MMFGCKFVSQDGIMQFRCTFTKSSFLVFSITILTDFQSFDFGNALVTRLSDWKWIKIWRKMNTKVYEIGTFELLSWNERQSYMKKDPFVGWLGYHFAWIWHFSSFCGWNATSFFFRSSFNFLRVFPKRKSLSENVPLLGTHGGQYKRRWPHNRAIAIFGTYWPRH